MSTHFLNAIKQSNEYSITYKGPIIGKILTSVKRWILPTTELPQEKKGKKYVYPSSVLKKLNLGEIEFINL